MSAPRVKVTKRPGTVEAWVVDCPECDESGRHDTAGQCMDLVRDHLRTEHPDLFERCAGCLGGGCEDLWPHCRCCPTCHGRGWTYRDNSKQ